MFSVDLSGCFSVIIGMSFAHMVLAGVSGPIFCLSCSSLPVQSPRFDGDRAYAYLVRQVEFGPRVPGTEASAKCRQYFYEHFRQCDLAVDSQNFSFSDPYSEDIIGMVNVIATTGPTSGEPDAAVLLMAHYDCRPRTDYASDPELLNMPIDGANDGASGVAVLMEMANLFAVQAPPCRVDVVLVDGEDWGMSGDIQHYMNGSREFAKSGIRGRYLFGLVVDLVGDRDQQIYREAFSQRYAGSLNDVIWRAAGNLGVATFHDSVKHTVFDDHVPLNIVGIPAAVIVDFDYAYWHTEFDTPDKCSAQSLANVGNVLAEIIYNPKLWPKK
jgi:glutaminyl-peptide cyclotransferase